MAGGISKSMVTSESLLKPGEERSTVERPNFRSMPGQSLLQAEVPLTVRQAAHFLGVSPQTVYLWVERKQIPHFRVMGRNIRFLQSDLQPFRAQFRQEVENVKTA